MVKHFVRLLNSLPSFEAAARHGSVKKACDELHVTHAAVSRHIQRIERELGRNLFDRSHRTMMLNGDGARLFSAVSGGFTQIQRALVHLSQGQEPDRLVISVDPDFAGLWLVPRLGEFYATVSNMHVEIRAERSSLPLQDPDIGCAIHYAEASSDSDNGEALFRSHLFPVCAKSLTQSLPLNSLDDLRHHTLLHDRSIVEWEQYLGSCHATFDMNLKSGPVFNETALCLDAAARGLGVALGDDFLAAMHLSEGRLMRAFCPSVLSKNTYYFAVSESIPRHPSIAAFRTWLLGSIERQRQG